MWFHTKKEDLEDNYKNFDGLCGIEEEYLIIKEDGTCIEAEDNIM
jgi:hypothetical protein